MPFLTEVHFQNFRSFLDAKCRLSPVTVVIGANNAGKSNFLQGVRDVAAASSSDDEKKRLDEQLAAVHHSNWPPQSMETRITLRSSIQNLIWVFPFQAKWMSGWEAREYDVRGSSRFILDERVIGITEIDIPDPVVRSNGEGVTRSLRWMWHRRDPTFEKIEAEFRKYVPEIECIDIADTDSLAIHVRETGCLSTAPVAQLSAGSRTILALLTIIHQPNRPELILLEDIEHSIHPRGLAPMIETIRRISKEHGVEFIMTTQSPYVLDCFQKKVYWADVVIVEKKDGVSTLTNADERLVALGYEREMDKVPLGDLWYSGLLGGVAGPNELWDKPEPTKS